MRARTVAQVIAAEAGGKTWAQRLSAMRDVASAIVNRANALGVSPEDVVGVTSEFNAYNKSMPAGTSRLTSLAEQALADVMSGGVTHNGMFYAREYATGNLPKGLKEVKKAVDGHVYFTDPKARAIRTAVGVLPVQKSALPQTVAAIPSPAPRATAQDMNALGMKAALGTRDFMSSNMARVAKAAGTPPSTYAARVTTPAPNSYGLLAKANSAPSDARMRPDISARMADTLTGGTPANSLVGGTNADTLAARMSPMEPGANIAHLTNSAPSMPSALGAPDPSRFGPTNTAQATWERMAPTSQDMALAHLTNPAPATALGNAFIGGIPAGVGIGLNPTLAPPPAIETAAPISRPKREPLHISVTKTASITPADPFAGKTIAGIKPDERFSVDSIDSAIGGPRGATFSAGPGLTTFSRGPNIGIAVHNAQTGMTTLYSPSGNITGVRRDRPTSGGFLGGLFGGGGSSSGSSLGGGYGGYGGSGGFGTGGGGSSRTGNSR